MRKQWCEAYLRGKDVLGLFVHFRGCCQFIRRGVLEKLGGFDEAFLADDMEISARLTEAGHRIRYASDVRAWQESPATVGAFFKQRTRWFRGTMEVALKYGRLMVHVDKRKLDAEATLLGPFILIASLLSYVAASGIFFASFPFNIMWNTFVGISTIGTTVMILLCGFALIYLSKPKKIRNLLWLPFVFGYWCLQAFVALYAGFLIILRRPKKWQKTEKSGAITSSEFIMQTEQVPA